MPTAVSTVDSAAGICSLAQALPRAFFSTRWSYLNMGFDPLQLRRIVLIQSLPTRKSMIIGAARTESQGVSLGFKAPRFEKGLAVAAISSYSEATHPQDEAEFMAEEALLFKYPCPYLHDEDGQSPFYQVYHGQFDDSQPSDNLPVTGRDICGAIKCVLSGQPASSVQKPSNLTYCL